VTVPTGDHDDLAALREAFVQARRDASRERHDAIFATPSDEAWDDIAPSHARFLGRLLGLTRPGGTVLDAACGTGKYWADIVASGRTVIGTDQLEGVLSVARTAHPEVPTACVALQDLAFEDLFDAVICVDALENIVPEDWPAVLRRLTAAARFGAPVWMTVELSNPTKLEQVYEQARAAGHPVVAGERFDGAGYHYYPPRSSMLAWLEASGLEILEQADGDGYWHLLVCRKTP
jgi:2-polyprenyl-3-methyl-5-hydroxy-6-metoxy-1,4-benzoquinol methylase